MLVATRVATIELTCDLWAGSRSPDAVRKNGGIAIILDQTRDWNAVHH